MMYMCAYVWSRVSPLGLGRGQRRVVSSFAEEEDGGEDVCVYVYA